MKKIAVVTGASSGMGREFALTLEKHVKVDEIWAIARTEKALAELGKQTEIPVKVVSMDLTDPESFTKYEQLLQEEQPEISLLVNASCRLRNQRCRSLKRLPISLFQAVLPEVTAHIS